LFNQPDDGQDEYESDCDCGNDTKGANGVDNVNFKVGQIDREGNTTQADAEDGQWTILLRNFYTHLQGQNKQNDKISKYTEY
jgi:hypothetical protein